MSLNFLDFEKPIVELETKIQALRDVSRHSTSASVDLDKELEQLEKKSLELKKKIFSDLGAWQVAQLARHPQRPYTLDYLKHIFLSLMNWRAIAPMPMTRRSWAVLHALKVVRSW